MARVAAQSMASDGMPSLIGMPLGSFRVLGFKIPLISPHAHMTSAHPAVCLYKLVKITALTRRFIKMCLMASLMPAAPFPKPDLSVCRVCFSLSLCGWFRS